MGKHAYLIMAHNQFELLSMLLECLDNERNDIYVHIDKKAICDINIIKNALVKSSCYFTKRIKVTWGGYSQIAAELLLLEMAVNNHHYDYYHLLTGVDFPLKNQREILQFFDDNKGTEFISCDTCSSEDLNRVQYYYWFQDILGENVVGKAMRKASVFFQQILNIRRNKKIQSWGVGSAYFDITDEFARYIVSNKNIIKKMFSYTRCADEIFLQTMYLNSPYFYQHKRFKNPIVEHKYIQALYLDVIRAIDWTRGKPYVYKEEDFEMLQMSGCLFARKFDYENCPQVVNKLYSKVKGEQK